MKLRWNLRTGAGANARLRLPPLVAEYFAAGRDLAAKQAPGADDLHAFRLATKKLRYTLELFRPCYGTGLEPRLDALRKVQQFLGDVNDCAATARLTATLLPEGSPDRLRVEQFLRERTAARTAEFREYWRSTFDGARGERWFTDYLSRKSRNPSPARK